MKSLSRLIVVLVLFLGVSAVDVHAQSSLLKQFEDEFVALSENTSPSVVEISVKSSKKPHNSGRMEELFKQFGVPNPEGAPKGDGDDDDRYEVPRPSAMGTGFFFDTNGYIVTNNHVVKDAEEITVQMFDGTEVDATIVGQDPSADLAVIKIDPEGLNIVPVKLGDSDTLKVGQFAIAIGSARGQTGSVSYGHISGLGREGLNLPGDDLRFQHFIQTDAAINLGNSGGPLCNIKGEVIGVNVAIVYDANSIGFAIPINRAKKIIPQLIANGGVTRGWLGVSMWNVELTAQEEEVSLEDYLEANGLADADGAYVMGVTSGGPAEISGIQPEDIIREVNGHKVKDSTDLINYVTDLEPGTAVDVIVWRAGKAVTLSLSVGKFPGKQVARYGEDYLGMFLTDLDLDEGILERLGVEELPSDFVIADVVPGGPADKAEIRRGDVVVEIAHQEVSSKEEFKKLLKEHAVAGKTLLMRVTQIGKEPRKVYIKVPDDYSAE